ncbi:alpha/beta hydrolase [Saccharopolyspora erythraea]|uniref:alpha/beta fold hydrolase n=1 Tax=Saccharopolyspora erythraea TaxID=1836 RepID=UPI001BA63E2B|nr:alpha/beta hydrolase [Saccharopolyspora erythraea]QUH05327.1 alpha/beta hydrolase [Saccharopolyspora erythraea]
MAATWTTLGRGAPVTLVVHGLGATEGEARIPSSGLPGTRVVLSLPGHGSAPDAPPGYWDYGQVAADVLAAADEVGATRAVGVSLGAGALTRIAADHPDRFDRLALLLPASLDRPRDVAAMWAFERLAEGVAAAPGDGGAKLRAAVAAEIPEGVDVGEHVARRADALLRLEDALRTLPERSAVSDASALAAATAEVLVVGATEDPMHPAEVAKSVAAAFSGARLELLPSAAPMLTHRRELRAMLVDFLG